MRLSRLSQLGLLIGLFQFNLAMGANIDPLEGTRCAAQIKMKLIELKSVNDWVRHADPSPRETAFRSPTKKIGSWIEVRIENKEAQVYLIDTLASTKMTWSNSCTEASAVVGKGRVMPKTQGDMKYFLDSDLQNLISKNKAGIIYIWSPGFVYSMKHYDNFKQAAKELKLPLTVLMDPTIPESQAKEMAKSYNMPFFNERVQSIDILMRGLGNHYPAMLVYSKGKITRSIATGVEETKDFVVMVKDELNRLNK